MKWLPSPALALLSLALLASMHPAAGQDASLTYAYAGLAAQVAKGDKAGVLAAAAALSGQADADPSLSDEDRAVLAAQLGDAAMSAATATVAAVYYARCVTLRGEPADSEALDCLRKQRDALAIWPPGGPQPGSVQRGTPALAAAESAVLAGIRLYGAASRAIVPDYQALARLAREAGDSAVALAADQRVALIGRSQATVARGLADGPAGGGFTLVRVFYGTNRSRTGRPEPGSFYGSGRGPLELGSVEVSIPRTHRYTALEAPSMLGFDLHADPERHILLLSVTPASAAAFGSALHDASLVHGRHEAFVFVHGYNVSFEKAARRAAQLAYDLGFEGAPIVYSWPSTGTPFGYLVDEANVSASAGSLYAFLKEVRTGLHDAGPPEQIHLLAHSMGSRALLAVLQRSAWVGDPSFDEVVFAAPDVDAGLFTDAMPDVARVARRVTLYASDNDVALIASRRLHGGFERAGQGGADLLALPGIDSVDLSAVAADELHHSYYGNAVPAVLDLLMLLWHDIPPGRRCGLDSLGGPSRWTMRSGACGEPDRLAAAILVRRFGTDAAKRAQSLDPRGGLSRFVDSTLQAESGDLADRHP